MRRSRASTCQPVIRRSGVTASVTHSITSVQVPVERVTNSTGLAPSPSPTPSTRSRASGSRHSANYRGLEGALHARVQKNFFRSMPAYSEATCSA